MKDQTYWRIKLSLIFNYVVFAILLNSVGAVILQVQGTFDISKTGASVLEGFKDIPIAITSFLIASFLPRLGIKRGMLIALYTVSAVSFYIYFFADQFWYFKMLFAIVGISFAIVKVSAFATIGLISNNSSEHSSFMSIVEGFFMVGVLLGNFFFSLFVIDADPSSTYWISIYIYLGGFTLLAALLLQFSELDESAANTTSISAAAAFVSMLRLTFKPLVIVFIGSAFLFVLIEQSFMTWTPTFYKDVLKVPSSMGIQAAAVLAGAFAFGRLVAGFILKHVHWLTMVVVSLILVGCLTLLNLILSSSLPEQIDTITWLNAPLVVYIFPLMGIFLSPIYPIINSVVLSNLPVHEQSAMGGMIVVFSALGGTTGSLITGYLFQYKGGGTAFYYSFIPLIGLITLLILLNRLTNKAS
jgi:fucose permease